MKKLAFLFILVAAISISAKDKDTSLVKTFNIGEYKLYLLSDFTSTGSKDLLIGASDEMLKKYVPDGSYPTAINCFAMRMQGKTILIDTGLGTNLLKNLAKVKIDPKEISAVLITHMHFDHIGGLLKDGKVVFPNADIYISKPEHAYWTSEKEMTKANDAAQGGFKLAVDVVKAYGQKVHLFTPNELGKIKENLFEGISAIAAYGHTPGHTLYMIESNNEKLLVWGDIAHAMIIQMPYPDVALKYDVDSKKAVTTRNKVLKYVSDNKIPIAGMHIVPPAAGTIEASGKGYSFTPFK
ncbi:MAG: MBL fold metallo-hydrolase [Spirochaetes bacterium]|nr:MBL fold metallo-hydrolase [Spirochaetota bacterium]